MEHGEFRCPSRIVGKVDQGELEVKCSSKRCGAGNGSVVMHYFDLSNGRLTSTKVFREPAKLFTDQGEQKCP